jgi:glycosyltransferase involved in cell wall biosynthesis
MQPADDSPIPTPKVSVCIPVFRGADFISDAIESVLAQDFRDFELLIVDDCSGDGTGKIIERYASQDPRIIYKVNDSNLGMVANWNNCLKMARGRYVKFLFQDDIFIFPDSLGKMVRILDAAPDVSLVASCRRVINSYSEVVKDEAFFSIFGYCQRIRYHPLLYFEAWKCHRRTFRGTIQKRAGLAGL